MITHPIYKYKLFIVSIILLLALILSSSDNNYHTNNDPRLQKFKSFDHFEISWINNEIYEVRDILSNSMSLYRLSYPRHLFNEDTVDQFIDLSQYNPDDFADMYTHQTTFPLGQSSGYSLIISDVDNDSLIEITGRWYNDYSLSLTVTGIYEQTLNGTFEKRRLFLDDSLVIHYPFGGFLTDLDKDSLYEINNRALESWGTFKGVLNLEADSVRTIPDEINFMSDSLIAYSGSYRIEDLDKDGIMECMGFDIYRDVFVAEYDTNSGKFEEVFIYETPQDHLYNFAVGDGDLDGKTDFIGGSIFGNVYIFENISDNQYALVWMDTLPYSNANQSAFTKDIDQNGKPEFFITFDGYYQGYAGTDMYWYESVGDNTYERKRRIFIVDTGFSSENGLHPHDMDGDGIEELVFDFSIPNRMFILNWNPSEYFDMYYYSHVSDHRELSAVTVYKPNGQNHPDIIFSTHYYPELPAHQSLYYKYNPITAIGDLANQIPKSIELYQNYPNPFNSSTLIKYKLYQKTDVTLSVFDITGRKIKTLMHETQPAGEHSILWDGSNNSDQQVGSGIYIYRLKANDSVQSKKLALIR